MSTDIADWSAALMATRRTELAMKNNTPLLVAAIAIVIALGVAAAWYHERQGLVEARAQIVTGGLLPIAPLLKDDQALLAELRAEPFSEKDAGILESYLAKIRRDTVAKHADMKQKLDALAENNTAIVTLLKAYASQARTAEFAAQGDKFRNYASAWRDRWNSVMELFMAGGNYAASGVPFPVGFPSAVDAEIEAAR
jgi:hypothetical protein